MKCNKSVLESLGCVAPQEMQLRWNCVIKNLSPTYICISRANLKADAIYPRKISRKYFRVLFGTIIWRCRVLRLPQLQVCHLKFIQFLFSTLFTDRILLNQWNCSALRKRWLDARKIAKRKLHWKCNERVANDVWSAILKISKFNI